MKNSPLFTFSSFSSRSYLSQSITSLSGAYVALMVIGVPAINPAIRGVYSAGVYVFVAVLIVLLLKLTIPS